MTNPIRCHVISSNPDDILFRLVLRLVECQTGLAGQHADDPLLRYERPGQSVRCVSVEMDLDAFGVFDRDETVGLEFAHADFGGTSETGSGAEHAVQGHGSVGNSYAHDYLQQW